MPPRKTSLDPLDYVIIQILHREARTPASEIARQTGTNERTVRKRIEWLVEDGIVRLTAVLNPLALGFVTAVDIFLEVDPEREDEILAQLMEMPEVNYVAYGQGTREISIQARFKDNNEIRSFLQYRLPEIPGLEVTRYTLVPSILRDAYDWMPRLEDLSSGNEA
jgi:DNA-binding Lrp family transcriptional regulator